MKKIIILLSVLILTGCDVEYRLTFNDDKIEENIQLILPKSKETEIDDLKKSPAYAIYDGLSQEPYNVEFNNGLVDFKANYSYIYDLKSFNRAYYINQCFDAISLAEHNGEYVLYSTKGFNCMLFNYQAVDNVKIILETNRVIIENNADTVKGNQLIWEINADNAEDIQIKVIFGEVKEKTIFDIIKDNLHIIGLVGGALLLIGIIIGYFAYTNKKNNQL